LDEPTAGVAGVGFEFVTGFGLAETGVGVGGGGFVETFGCDGAGLAETGLGLADAGTGFTEAGRGFIEVGRGLFETY
jgi:hypothetical protein